MAGYVGYRGGNSGTSDSSPDHLESPESAPDEESGWHRGESDEEVYHRVHPEELYSTGVPSEPSAPGLRCAQAAGIAVFDYIQTRLDSMEGITYGYGRAPPYNGYSVSITLTTMHDRDGDTIEEPEICFDRVVAETPATGFATVEFETGDYDCAVPVYVQEADGHMD